jgi:hypothetical protein
LRSIEDPTAEVTNPRAQPDRGITPRAAELEHLAAGLRRDEAEQEAAGRRRHRARALLGRQALATLLFVLDLQAREDVANAVVEHV